MGCGRDVFSHVFIQRRCHAGTDCPKGVIVDFRGRTRNNYQCPGGGGKGADRPSPRATRIRGVRARLAQSMWFMAPPLRALRGGLAEPPVSPARQATGYALSPEETPGRVGGARDHLPEGRVEPPLRAQTRGTRGAGARLPRSRGAGARRAVTVKPRGARASA